MGYYASRLSLAARLENGPRLEDGECCYRAQDTMTFLRMLDKAWERTAGASKGARIKKVSVTLHGLTAAGMLQPELFAELPDADLRARQKAEKMSRALDKLNHRFGRDCVSVGMMPGPARDLSGTKIAFTRIPDIEEFLE